MGFRVLGLRFRVQGLRFRVQGSGFCNLFKLLGSVTGFAIRFMCFNSIKRSSNGLRMKSLQCLNMKGLKCVIRGYKGLRCFNNRLKRFLQMFNNGL